MAKKGKDIKFRYIHRDLSWLSFNERVLQEAEDKRVPLNERVRFLGIFSNNQDEFFRVRVATLRRMAKLEKEQIKAFDIRPSKIIGQIQKKVLVLKNRFDSSYLELLKELEKENIFLLNEKQLDKQQGEAVRDHFNDNVRPRLFPIMLDNLNRLPVLSDTSIYLAVRLTRDGQLPRFSLIEVPDKDPSRFFVLPSQNERLSIILLDDVIRYNLDTIYQIFEYDKIEAYTIKLTRDAELDFDSDLSQSLIELIQKSVKRRVKGEPVRFIYDAEMPKDMLDFLTKKVKLQKDDALIPGARYHNFKDFIKFPDLRRIGLRYRVHPPVLHPDLHPQMSVFQVIRRQDVMLHFPYQTFNHVIDFLREAAITPSVTHIYMTLYRVAKNSSVVLSLINAARNGKSVTVVMELQARFDEENNIYWANRLQEEGVRVIYGVNKLKVHAKLCLVRESVGNRTLHYASIGTGNFNEETARLYTDIMLMTTRPSVVREVIQVFSFFDNQYDIGAYKNLIMAPLFLRDKMRQLIKREIRNAEAGKPASIFIKVNNLVDKDIIRLLYEASEAGVDIRLIVRSACSLVPEVKGMSSRIRAISILDKFLEHPRIYYFHNDGKEDVYIGSADVMERNIDNRVEVLVRLLDHKIRQQVIDILEIQWSDNMKARNLSQQHLNEYIQPEAHEAPVRSQIAIYEYFKNYLETENPDKSL
ncbi:MAG: polyphosphate kinase 1 [Chitinophagales bacterium]|nr:polyphosphate kinase 1 [Chitinophagales bacterium]HAE13985.1 polyphosphate kinase 1 [Bacteroidota bacterium]MCB9019131.1 polyphosphate kinase 1 [Chitinophagales bacterium]MCB9021860.1 polyphosphate kinase 1 [Chitinophagales bacterium]MCB9030889.1 polyphosphate kinase 1 [Chitinophagales bacterium]